MNKKSLMIGMTITCIWFLGIYLFCFINGYKLPETLNELGDFLAGIFAPVAFFWLILGYVQQGKQLDQNTKALEQQERALQLQIEEIRESVKQQREMNLINKNQYAGVLKTFEPIIAFSKTSLREYNKQINEYDENGNFIDILDVIPSATIYLTVDNNGKEARNVKLLCVDGIEYNIAEIINEKSSKEISFDLENVHYSELKKSGNLIITGIMLFESLYGVQLKRNFKVNIFKQRNYYSLIFGLD